MQPQPNHWLPKHTPTPQPPPNPSKLLQFEMIYVDRDILQLLKLILTLLLMLCIFCTKDWFMWFMFFSYYSVSCWACLYTQTVLSYGQCIQISSNISTISHLSLTQTDQSKQENHFPVCQKTRPANNYK